MKLITEEISNAEYIVEEKNGKKNYSIKGIFMQSDVKNRNGRIYPKEILQKEKMISMKFMMNSLLTRQQSNPADVLNAEYLFAKFIAR